MAEKDSLMIHVWKQEPEALNHSLQHSAALSSADLKATPQNGYESLAPSCGSSAVGWHRRAALGGLESTRVLSKQQAVITALSLFIHLPTCNSHLAFPRLTAMAIPNPPPQEPWRKGSLHLIL